MAVQASGQISFDDANIELQRASGTQISFNEAASRRLATITGRDRTANNSEITITDWYGGTFSIQGQALYTTVGTTDWTCPDGVYSVCAVAIGGGGGGYHSGAAGNGGGGGGLGWRNDIAVTPGAVYTVVVGQAGVGNDYGLANGGESYFINTTTARGRGGVSPNSPSAPGTGGGYNGQGGGSGGTTSGYDDTAGRGGSGAGGYSGNGNSQTGGAGGKGGGGDSQASGGGGVNPFGRGTSGANKGYQQGAGGGGSGGQAGQGKNGGLYGGGGGGADASGSSGYGAKGCVRIIWGLGRAFPDTNTANVTAGTFYNGINYA